MNQLDKQTQLTSPDQKISVTHRMGSLTVFVEPNDDQTSWVVSADRLGRWLADYNEYWIISSGIDTGENLHWCYDRSINIRGKNIHRQPNELACLMQHVCTQNIAGNWILDLDEYLELEPTPRAFLEMVGVKSITLVIDEKNDQRIDTNFVQNMCALYESDINITMTGYMDRIMASGLLERRELNQSQVSLINRRGPNEKRELKIGYRSSCQTRIQLVVGGHGYIYPCLGLAGLKSCVMGHIDDPVETIFERPKNPNLDINTWVTAGPDIPEKLEAVVNDGIVLECHTHRNAMITKHGA